MPVFVGMSGVHFARAAQQFERALVNGAFAHAADTAAAPSPCCGSARPAARPSPFQAQTNRRENPESALPLCSRCTRRRISAIVRAKIAAPPSGWSSRFTDVTTA